jgi:3-deoxy-D-manno-octulosonic-acid transferase
VDAFLKVNVKNIQRVFVLLSTHAHKKYVILDDVRAMNARMPQLEATD